MNKSHLILSTFLINLALANEVRIDVSQVKQISANDKALLDKLKEEKVLNLSANKELSLFEEEIRNHKKDIQKKKIVNGKWIRLMGFVGTFSTMATGFKVAENIGEFAPYQAAAGLICALSEVFFHRGIETNAAMEEFLNHRIYQPPFSQIVKELETKYANQLTEIDESLSNLICIEGCKTYKQQ